MSKCSENAIQNAIGNAIAMDEFTKSVGAMVVDVSELAGKSQKEIYTHVLKKIEKLIEQKEKNDKDLQTLSQKIESLEKDNRELQNQIGKQKQPTKLDSIVNLDQFLIELKTSIEESDKKIKNLTSANQELQKLSDELTTKEIALHKQLAEKNKTINELTAEIRILQEKDSAQKIRISDLTEGFDSARGTYAMSLDQMNAIHKREIAELQNANKHLEENLSVAKDLYTKQNQELAAVKMSYEIAKTTNVTLELKYFTLNAEFCDAKVESIEKTKIIDEIKKENALLLENTANAEAKLRDLQQNHIPVLKSDIENLQAKLSSQTASPKKFDMSDEEIQGLLDKISEYEKVLVPHLEQKLADLKEEFMKIDKLRIQYQTDCHDLTDLSNTKTKVIIDLNVEIDHLRQENEFLRRETYELVDNAK